MDVEYSSSLLNSSSQQHSIVTPGQFSNVLGGAFLYLMILPASKSINTTLACLASYHSTSGAWHIRRLALEVSEDVVGLLIHALAVDAPDDYVVVAARRNQSVVRTEGQSIDTPITEIIKQKLMYLLFGMTVVQLVDALAFFPSPDPDVPIVTTRSQHQVLGSIAPTYSVEVSRHISEHVSRVLGVMLPYSYEGVVTATS